MTISQLIRELQRIQVLTGNRSVPVYYQTGTFPQDVTLTLAGDGSVRIGGKE